MRFLRGFTGRRAAFRIGVIATLAIAVAANVAVLGNLGVLFAPPVPGTANRNLYEPYFKPLNLRSEQTIAFGMFRPVYDRLSALLEGRADIALYEINGAPVDKGEHNRKLLHYLYVTPSLAKVLGIHVIAGRSLAPSDMAPDAAPVMVVSAKLARGWFGSYAAAIGQTLRISGQSHRIVGVLPPTLQFPSQRFLGGRSLQAWMPLPPEAASEAKSMNRRMYAIVHPHPGFTVAALKVAFADAFQQALPEFGHGVRTYMKQIHLVQRVSPLAERQYGPVLTRLRLLELAALLLLVLVFTNLAGLTTSDAIVRRHELAARATLGAGGWRLFLVRFRLLLGLGLVGWMAGIGLGWLGQRALAAAIGQAGVSVAFSPPVLLITLGFVTVIAMLLSTIGLLRLGKPRNLLADLASGGHTTGSRKMVRAMRSLIALQLAMSVVLLAVAGHFYVNVFGLTHNKLGFSLSRRSFFESYLPGADSRQKKLFDQRILARLNRRSDIESAARLSIVPFSEDNSSTNAWLAGEGNVYIPINEQQVSKHFADAMGLKVLAGDPDKVFSGSGHEIFIDATAMRKLWLDKTSSEVVGRSLYLGLHDNGPYRVAAVVAPLRMKAYGSIGGTFFASYRFATLYGATNLIVHSSLPPDLLRKAVASSIYAVNPRVMLLSSQTVKGAVDKAYAGRTHLGRVFAMLAMLALLIAAVGLFALLAYRSLVRRPEFAIRGSLGATPGRLLGSVLSEAFALWLVGCALGIPATYALSIVLASHLPELGLPAAWVAAAVAIGLGLTALAAALAPARRAAGIDLAGNLTH